MKVHIDIDLNGHRVQVQVDYKYAIDGDIVHIDDVWLGGAQIRQLIDEDAVNHLVRCARYDWQHFNACRQKSRQIPKHIIDSEREAYMNDLINRARHG